MALINCGVMRAEIDHDRTTIHMPGQAPVVILRPAAVSVGDWNSFWGGFEPEGNPMFLSMSVQDMHKDALRKHSTHFGKGPGM